MRLYIIEGNGPVCPWCGSPKGAAHYRASNHSTIDIGALLPIQRALLDTRLTGMASTYYDEAGHGCKDAALSMLGNVNRALEALMAIDAIAYVKTSVLDRELAYARAEEEADENLSDMVTRHLCRLHAADAIVELKMNILSPVYERASLYLNHEGTEQDMRESQALYMS